MMAPTTVPESHTSAAAPATYVTTADLFSVSSHLSAMVLSTSSVLILESARADTATTRLEASYYP